MALRGTYLVAAPKNAERVGLYIRPCSLDHPSEQDINQGRFFPVQTLLSSSFAARVSSDNPRLNAFCRVAPSVLLNVRAMFAARVLLAASLFNLRTSLAVHARLFIIQLQDRKMKAVLLAINKT